MSKEKRPEWMQSISSTLNAEDYLLGKKIDKTFELCQEEKVKLAREARAELIANNKIILAGDPILELERRRERLKWEIINNPIKLRQLREKLLRDECKEKDKVDSSNARHDVRGNTSPTPDRRFTSRGIHHFERKRNNMDKKTPTRGQDSSPTEHIRRSEKPRLQSRKSSPRRSHDSSRQRDYNLKQNHSPKASDKISKIEKFTKRRHDLHRKQLNSPRR